VKRVRIDLDGTAVVAALHEDEAPVAVARFWAALPISATLRHVRWSGEAGYIIVKSLADPAQPLEKPVSMYPPNSIILRPVHGELAFPYGRAQARDQSHLADQGCHIATIQGNASTFLALVKSTCESGAKPIVVTREGEG
jgi:hypothetical protein